MGVMNWVQSRIHGVHHSIAGSTQPVEISSRIPWTYELDDVWSTAMLSTGTFGTREGHRLKSSDGSTESCTVGVKELKKLQEELRLIMRTKGVTTTEELKRVHHLPLERLLNCSSHSQSGGTVNLRSVRKPLASAFSGFMPRPSFRETVFEVRFNEVIWGLPHKNAHSKNSAFSDHVIRDDRVVQKPQKGKAGVHKEGGRWIRTDSEYIVLEI